MYSVLNKRFLAVIAFILLLVSAFVAEGFLFSSSATADNPLYRKDYISSLGIKVDYNSQKTEDVKIPEHFSPVYLRYNLMQKQAGFDLSDYRGLTVKKYSYKVTDMPFDGDVTLTLLVYAGRIIGGDVSESRIDGFMVPLYKEEIKAVKKENRGEDNAT